MNRESELLRYTGHLIRRAQQRHAAIWLRDVSASTTSTQFAALVVLSEQPRASQRGVGQALDLDRATIADLIDRMVKRGLIARTRDEADRRRNILLLTGAGRSELERLRPRVAAIEPELTGGLNAVERTELRRLLLAILDARDPNGHEAVEDGRLSR